MLPVYLNVNSIEKNYIIGSPDLHLVKKCYESKKENILQNYIKVEDDVEYIWKILCSSRFSVYSKKMIEPVCRKNKEYIRQCLERQDAVHIVLAGFPGKCANYEKVSNKMPDLGELAVLCQLHLINLLIKQRHPTGIRVSFMSDYLGLGLTFFPDLESVKSYVEKLRQWIALYGFEIEIVFVTDMLPQIKEFESEFRGLRVQELAELYKNEHCLNQLEKSIYDNMNIFKARQFYNENYSGKISDVQICKIAREYYEAFWEFFAVHDTVNRYFGDVIYGSPVAYHPDRRLCLRLQSRSATVAPWNGNGVIGYKEIYSMDQRICNVSDYYKPIVDEYNYFWGFYKVDEP